MSEKPINPARAALLLWALVASHLHAAVTPPAAPTIGSAAAGDGRAFVSFTPPADDGGAAISNYVATCQPGDLKGSAQTAPIAVAGLANGTLYACSVAATNTAGTGPASAVVGVTPQASAPLTLLGVKSRKTHGPAGTFDVAIDNTEPIDGAVSVEPRAIGAGHSIVFQYNAPVTVTGPASAVDDTAAAVPVNAAPSGNDAVVTLPALPDNKRVTISLPTVNGAAVNASASVGFLLGDVDASRSLGSSDLSAVKARAGQRVNAANFRFDLTRSGAVSAADIAALKARLGGGPPPPSGPTPNPILFVTQVPLMKNFSRTATFSNHGTAPDEVVRGGDLMIRYPDGALRNLTREAGFGMDGLQEGANAIAVREPTVHWDGQKAVFSMLRGAPPQFQVGNFRWQLYEVTGLGQGQAVSITKVPNQPTSYNNVSPFYGTDERILFTSDRPRNGQAHLYPQLDEYESSETVTGIWSLNPATGDLKLLNHTVSGAFSPFIDSFGRVVFNQWDHLQRDQQADAGGFNYQSESPGAAALATNAEVFPESRDDGTASPVFGAVNGHTFNHFTPWQMNEDGSDNETLNHIGRQEFVLGYLARSFKTDNVLTDAANDSFHANRKEVRIDGGLFHLREDPVTAGTYYAIAAREFGSLTSDQIVKFTGAPSVSPDAMVITDVTKAEGLAAPGGRYRNPLPLKSGALMATHSNASTSAIGDLTDFRLKLLTLNPASGFFQAGAPITPGITKVVSWWDPNVKLNNGTAANGNGVLWELEPVEVVARPRPMRPAETLPAIESAVFAEEGVNENTFRTWLRTNNLALIVTRNQTSRDRGDFQQPFNLRVPGGVQKVRPGGGRVYDIQHFQIFQADLIRAYNGKSGRRPIAQPLHDAIGNIANPGGPAGSVRIAADGSTAAFVPAKRALAWQTTDPSGEPVVRERVWVTMQPGEVRVCASCHGVNTKDQAGGPPPANKPEALRELLRAWKLLP